MSPLDDDLLKQHGNKPLSWRAFSQIMFGTITPAFKALRTRIETLEATAANAPAVEYAGVFEEGKAYGPGKLVTRRGGLWLSLRDTVATPGSDPKAWRLIVKEGHAR